MADSVERYRVGDTPKFDVLTTLVNGTPIAAIGVNGVTVYNLQSGAQTVLAAGSQYATQIAAGVVTVTILGPNSLLTVAGLYRAAVAIQLDTQTVKTQTYDFTIVALP